MSNIIIIGGGISGLAALHYLKQKFSDRNDVSTLLLEKNVSLGGTIQTIKRNDCLFETGPNGFLNNKPRTLEFFKEIGLNKELVEASPEAKLRFISLRNKLYPIPTSPKSFLTASFLSPLDKIRVLGEIFIPKGNNPQENIFDFGQRRLGKKFTEVFLDAMVSGIYGGEIRDTNLKAAFPRIYALEQEYGSLFKAMFVLKGKGGMPAGTLTSFKQGMGSCMEVLGQRYKENILLNQEVEAINFLNGQYRIETRERTFEANELFLCCPAYSASKIFKAQDPKIPELLEKIPYAPIVVVGLVFSLKSFLKKPVGFGFLIPSSEKKEVLGVLLDSNIFKGRCPQDHILFRVMIGGARFPDILNKSEEELTQIAIKEVKNHFSLQGSPTETFFTSWSKGIPQYNQIYVKIQEELKKELKSWSHFHIVANYWHGISFNDCIENAFQEVQKLAL